MVHLRSFFFYTKEWWILCLALQTPRRPESVLFAQCVVNEVQKKLTPFPADCLRHTCVQWVPDRTTPLPPRLDTSSDESQWVWKTLHPACRHQQNVSEVPRDNVSDVTTCGPGTQAGARNILISKLAQSTLWKRNAKFKHREMASVTAHFRLLPILDLPWKWSQRDQSKRCEQHIKIHPCHNRKHFDTFDIYELSPT